MSKRMEVAAEVCTALGGTQSTPESYPLREVRLGELAVARALPIRDRRLIGPWCFLDRFGPLTFAEGKPMDVAPHPHIGLQTVTWLMQGEVMHDDSLGSESLLRPGGVNVMTSGAGIAHSEQTPRDHSGKLNGVQLWVALPEAERHQPAGFQQLDDVPMTESAAGRVSVFSGGLGTLKSGATHYSELVGAELQVHRGGTLTVELDASFEHGLLVLGGEVALHDQPLPTGYLYYLGLGCGELSLTSPQGAQVLLIGGPPFPERILMWWNFVARTPEEITAARTDWEERRRFGEVAAYQGPRLNAPSLLRFARPNPVS